MSSQITVKKRQPFSVIPDSILEDTRMRPETRLVLGWLIGRPDGWEVRVSYLQHTLGLTKPRWAKARKEMMACGYLNQVRRKSHNGKFVWEHVVTHTPTLSQETMVRKSTDGKPIDEKPGDITISPQQQDSNTPLNPPMAISSAGFEEAHRRFPGFSIEALENAWLTWLRQKKSKPPENPDLAFLAWAASYTKNHPLPYGGGF